MSRINALLAVAGMSCLLASGSSPAAADPVADFYKGRTGTVISGYGPSSVYSVYARLVSNHIGRHLPGNPAFVVQTMAGAGSMRAAGFLYNAAAKDGTTIGGIGRGVATEPLVFGKRSRTKFDPRKFHWLGSLNSEVSIGAAWHTSGIKTLADAKKTSIFLPTGGQASDSAIFTYLTNAILGTKFKLVAGYRSGGSQNLALERGEVGGRIGWSWSSVAASKRAWVEDGKIIIFAQYGLEKHPDLPKVPLITELTNDPDKKKILEVALIRQGMGRPYVAPPGVPTDRAKALQTAFAQMLSDPAFLAEAGRLKLEINAPKTGPQVQALLDRAFDLPQSLKDRVAAAADPANAQMKKLEKTKK